MNNLTVKIVHKVFQGEQENVKTYMEYLKYEINAAQGAVLIN